MIMNKKSEEEYIYACPVCKKHPSRSGFVGQDNKHYSCGLLQGEKGVWHFFQAKWSDTWDGAVKNWNDMVIAMQPASVPLASPKPYDHKCCGSCAWRKKQGNCVVGTFFVHTDEPACPEYEERAEA